MAPATNAAVVAAGADRFLAGADRLLAYALCPSQVRPEYIIPLVEELHGKKWPKFNSEKICNIAYGRIQVRCVCFECEFGKSGGKEACSWTSTSRCVLAVAAPTLNRRARGDSNLSGAHSPPANLTFSLSSAVSQGKAALVQHFQNSSLLHEDKRCRPVLFHTDGVLAGEQEPFPTSATPPI